MKDRPVRIKPVFWMASSRKDLKAFPKVVQSDVGYALFAAQRELREEGGYRAGRLALLTRFHPSIAYLDEVAYGYAAWDLVPDPLPADGDEFLERRVVPLAEAVRMAVEGEITESVSKLALLQYVARPPGRP